MHFNGVFCVVKSVTRETQNSNYCIVLFILDHGYITYIFLKCVFSVIFRLRKYNFDFKFFFMSHVLVKTILGMEKI